MSRHLAASSRLPPELFDRIIDHLHGDRPSLKACAQACKQFLPVSRLHLLHTITFLPDNSRHATIESFLGGFPAAVACARVLYVKKYYDNTRDKPQARVISILRLLPFVRTLRFEMDVLSDELLILAPTLLASITTLEFIHAQFPSFGHLSRLLLAMPQLTVLRLDGAWWPTGSVDPDYCNHRLHLVELDLRPSAPNDFIDWYVRGLPSYGTIDGPSYPSTLCLREPVLGNTDRFSTTLIDHAAHLRVWSTPLSYLRLRKLKNLVTLTLDYTQMSSSASMLAIAVDMPCLSSIIVCCWLFAFLPTLSHKGTCVDWAALAKVLLSEASSPQLKMFKITVTGVRQFPDRGRMPNGELASALLARIEDELAGTAAGNHFKEPAFPYPCVASGRFNTVISSTVNGIQRMKKL